MRATRLSFVLVVAWSAVGCGANPPEPAFPDQDVNPQTEVIVENGTLMLVDGSEIVAMSIRFAVDDYELDERDERVLDLLAEFLAANAQIERIRVQGHSDERGTEDYNRRLSRRRAVVVRDYLTEQGIDESRLRVEWYGADRPVARGRDESAYSLNRRVEFRAATRPGT